MAELRPHYIDVDLKKNTQYNVPVVTQNDTATHFIIRVTDDGLADPGLLDAYQEITMTSQRPDGESFYLTGSRISGTNEIEFHLGTDETAFHGSVLASLQFYLVEDASRYTSAQFRYDVKKDLTTNYTPTQREETLVEVVLKEGPGVIQDAKDAKQAVDVSLVELEQDKTAAIGRLDEVTEENKTVFRQPVNTFADLATTYPNPEHGTTVRVTSEAASYRYSDGTWVKTDEYNPTAIDQVTAQLADTANELDKTYSASETFDPIVVAREKGRHLAFGSIERVATIASQGYLNRNLVVYRSGTSHELDGKIKGVYVSDTGYAMGEPFNIASPQMFPNIGRNGDPTPNDFRDPNLFQLGNGKVLLTFFAINLDEARKRTAIESYAMVGTWNDTFKTLDWSPPVLLFPSGGKILYGKPFIEGDYLYSAAYTASNFDVGDGFERGYVTMALLSDPTAWTVIGNPIYKVVGAEKTEPVLRPRPSGGYFVQVRDELSGKRLIRYDSDTIDGIWSTPVTVYEGSSHAKGLQVLGDGSYFTGIRMLTSSPGVAILTSDGSAETPVSLKLSGVVYSSPAGTGEAGYMEFAKVGNETYLAMFHTDAGRSIQCASFTESMIKNKVVKEQDSAFPIQKPIGAERLDQLIHIGQNASRSHNLIPNPIFYIPHGFTNPPHWSSMAILKSTGLETDSPGAGYGKVTTAGGTLTSKIKNGYNRVFAHQPVIAAARVYCKSPNRIRCNVIFGTTRVSAYHGGTGWETLTVILKNTQFYSLDSEGGISDPISFNITTAVGDTITYYLDWASLGFGETVPEVVNDTVERLMNIANVTLSAKSNTFNLVDLGFPSPAYSTSYIVNIIDSRSEILGYSVTKTSTSFTITLADGTPWGSSLSASIEIIGV